MANWGEAGKGALGGGATGWAVGGPVGGLVGGAIGGLSGLFGGDSDQDRYRKMMEEYYGGLSPQQAQYSGIGQFERAGMGQEFRGDQRNLLNFLSEQMAGRGPSLANETLRQGMQTGISQQQALAATGRGNPALAQRQAAQGAAGMTSGYAGQAAQNRLQEQLNAQSLYGQVAQGARGQDLQASQWDAGQQNMRALEESRGINQNNQFNVGAYQNNDQMRLQALQAMMGGASGTTFQDNLMNTGGQALAWMFANRGQGGGQGGPVSMGNRGGSLGIPGWGGGGMGTPTQYRPNQPGGVSGMGGANPYLGNPSFEY